MQCNVSGVVWSVMVCSVVVRSRVAVRASPIRAAMCVNPIRAAMCGVSSLKGQQCVPPPLSGSIDGSQSLFTLLHYYTTTLLHYTLHTTTLHTTTLHTTTLQYTLR